MHSGFALFTLFFGRINRTLKFCVVMTSEFSQTHNSIGFKTRYLFKNIRYLIVCLFYLFVPQMQ